MATRECRTCGAGFELTGRGGFWYCEQHRVERKAAKARDARNFRVRHRVPQEPKQCVVCGKEFIGYRPTTITCSQACRSIHTNGRLRRAYEQRNRGRCTDCGAGITRNAKQGLCRQCANKAGAGKRSGANNYGWKGGRVKDGKGYIYLLVAPDERKGHRYRAEHIVVWEKTHGMPLPQGFVVHHLNGKKDDNRPENLEVRSRAKHNHFETVFAQLESRVAELERIVKEWQSKS